MDFKDQIKSLAEKVTKLQDQIRTEEATKNAIIMPFLQAMGYDVFNPLEVVPEYVADVGTKQGEKVDYAIIKDEKPVIIFECKWWGEDLTGHMSQLFRYFSTTSAKFAVLTNGIRYQFYSDLEDENKMDEKPFLDFDITKMPDIIIDELKKFHKSYFDIEEIITTASELKYRNEVMRLLRKELREPSPDFVRFIVKQVYSGKATEKVVSFFTDIISRSANHLIAEMVNEKIKAALEDKKPIKEEIVQKEEPEEEKSESNNTVITTEEELEGFAIIKSVLRNKKVEPSRLSYKDTINYFLIYFDDSVRKPICRLWLNGKKKYFGLFDENKDEVKHPIESIDDIYNFEEQLLSSVERYKDTD